MQIYVVVYNYFNKENKKHLRYKVKLNLKIYF